MRTLLLLLLLLHEFSLSLALSTSLPPSTAASLLTTHVTRCALHLVAYNHYADHPRGYRTNQRSQPLTPHAAPTLLPSLSYAVISGASLTNSTGSSINRGAIDTAAASVAEELRRWVRYMAGDINDMRVGHHECARVISHDPNLVRP